MTLTPEQFNALVGAVVALIVALAAYLNNQASQKRSTETQNKVDRLQTRVDDVHAAVVTAKPSAPAQFGGAPNAASTFTGVGSVSTADWQKPAPPKPPG